MVTGAGVAGEGVGLLVTVLVYVWDLLLGAGVGAGPARAQACTLHQGCTPPTPATHPSVETRGPWAGAARLDPTAVLSFIKSSHGWKI